MSRPGRQLRVLVVTGREPWPLNGGGRLRLYHYLKHLASRVELTLALPDPPRFADQMPAGVRVTSMHGAAPVAATTGQPLAWTIWRARQHFGYRPSTVNWLAASARPERFDVALLYGAVTGQYIDALRVPVVWDAVDELVLYTLRDATRRGVAGVGRALRAIPMQIALERYVARRAATSIFAAPLDASYCRRWAPGARVVALTNGVDLDYFDSAGDDAQPGLVTFVGALDFPPNVDAITRFARQLWPAIRAGHFDRRLCIVGRSPVPAVRALAALPGVEVHSDVPDVRPYLDRSSVVVVPTRLGGGVKNKVLEACAMGRAVVAGPRAVAGLSARLGRDVLVARRPEEWVRCVSALLHAPQRAAAFGRRARAWVQRAHSWPALADRLCTVLHEAAQTRHNAPHEPHVVSPAPTRKPTRGASNKPSAALQEVPACR
jgi:glycosyltransferase involved in cell wall biosynthesis